MTFEAEDDMTACVKCDQDIVQCGVWFWCLASEEGQRLVSMCPVDDKPHEPPEEERE